MTKILFINTHIVQKMELHIQNFRGITDKHLSFKPGMTLLSGDSGKGKTTVLESVRWCLYGSRRNVYPLDVEKPPKEFTKVTLKINEYTFTRTKPPESVKVTGVIAGEEQTLTGVSAENFICQLFGSKNLWLTQSYIPQDERNLLICGSNAEKMEILREAIFQDEENPQDYTEVVKENIEKIKDELTKNSQEYNIYLGVYNTKMDTYKDELEFYTQNKSLQVVDISKKIYVLQKEKAFIENNIKILKQKEELIQELESISRPLPDISVEDMHKVLRVKELREKTADLKISDEVIDISEEEVSSELKKWAKIKSVKKKFNISNIPERITELEEIIKKCEIMEQVKETKQREDKIRLELKDVTDQLNSLNEEMRDLEDKWTGCDKLDKRNYDHIFTKIKETDGCDHLCPNCGVGLIMNMGKLKTVDSSLKTSEKKALLSMLETYSKLVNKENNISIKCDKLKLMLSSMPGTEYEDLGDVNEYKREYKELLVCEEPIHSEEELRKLESELRVRKQVEELNNEIALTKKSIKSVINKDIVPCITIELVKECEKTDRKIKEINGKIKYLPELYETAETIESIDEKLIIYEEERKNIERLKRAKQIFKEVENLKDEISLRQENIKVLEIRFKNLNNLLQVIEDALYTTLDSYINELNETCNNILAELFDEPIIVDISLFKEYKNKKENVRNMFNIKVEHKGLIYDNLNDMSGGEKDRLSFVLAIAMARNNSSPILMLDESTSSLNANWRVMCVDVIKRYAEDKTVINVCHDAVEGYYDEVVYL